MTNKNEPYIPKFVDESVRLELKKKAKQVTMEYALSGISNIFEMIEDKALLIKAPYCNSKGKKPFSGFCTFIDNHFVVFINTSYSLGHQHYTAAHELYHIFFDAEDLKKKKLLQRNDDTDKEELAQAFAAELLMPEDRLRSMFLKEIGDKEMNVHHTIRLHQLFKVSYKSMVTRCLRLGLINESVYRHLVQYGTLENAEQLHSLTKENGYKIDLLIHTDERYVSRKYIDFAIDNFKNKKISVGRLKSLLEYAGIEDWDAVIKKDNEEKHSQ